MQDVLNKNDSISYNTQINITLSIYMKLKHVGSSWDWNQSCQKVETALWSSKVEKAIDYCTRIGRLYRFLCMF